MYFIVGLTVLEVARVIICFEFTQSVMKDTEMDNRRVKT